MGGWRAAELRRCYGISVAEYESLLRQQRGRCFLCGKKPTTRRLAVDHDHETKVIRGLLCTSCNVRLSGLEDAAFRVRALAYLARFKQCSRCREHKKVADFARDSTRPTGRDPRCRACRSVSAQLAKAA